MIENEPELSSVFIPEKSVFIKTGDSIKIYGALYENIRIFHCDYADPNIGCTMKCGALAYIVGEKEQRTSSSGHCLRPAEFITVIPKSIAQINKVTEI